MVSDIKKASENNKRLVPTIKKIIETIKYYFKLDLTDEKYEKIFNILFDAVSATNKFAKKNNLIRKNKDAYKALLETMLYFFNTISAHYSDIDKK